jgi:hypothetical protein
MDSPQNPAADLLGEFKRRLVIMSNSRAGWDYQLPAAQKAQEDREEKTALAQARAIWSENPALHDDLRAAFADTKPLATMREIENAPAGASL